jgi:hypothetical protein
MWRKDDIDADIPYGGLKFPKELDLYIFGTPLLNMTISYNIVTILYNIISKWITKSVYMVNS